MSAAGRAVRNAGSAFFTKLVGFVAGTQAFIAGFTPIVTHTVAAPSALGAKLRSVVLTSSAIVVAMLPIVVIESAVGAHIAYAALDSAYIVVLFAFRAVIAGFNGAFCAGSAFVAKAKTFALGAALTFWAFEFFKAVLAVSAAGRTVRNAGFFTLCAKVFAVVTLKAHSTVAAPIIGTIFALAALGAQILIVAANTAFRAVLFLLLCAVKAHMAVAAPLVGAVFANLFAFLADFGVVVTFIARRAVQLLLRGALKAHSAVLANAKGAFIAKIALGAAHMTYSTAQNIAFAAVGAGVFAVDMALKAHIRALV